MQTMQPEVYIRKLSAVLPNAPVGNDQMEAVLGMVGGLPSRVRRTILRSNAITPSIRKPAAPPTPIPSWPPPQCRRCLTRALPPPTCSA